MPSAFPGRIHWLLPQPTVPKWGVPVTLGRGALLLPLLVGKGDGARLSPLPAPCSACLPAAVSRVGLVVAQLPTVPQSPREGFSLEGPGVRSKLLPQGSHKVPQVLKLGALGSAKHLGPQTAWPRGGSRLVL